MGELISLTKTEKKYQWTILFSWRKQNNDKLKQICDDKNYDERYILVEIVSLK